MENIKYLCDTKGVSPEMDAASAKLIAYVKECDELKEKLAALREQKTDQWRILWDALVAAGKVKAELEMDDYYLRVSDDFEQIFMGKSANEDDDDEDGITIEAPPPEVIKALAKKFKKFIAEKRAREEA